jgi:hypothetical protein
MPGNVLAGEQEQREICILAFPLEEALLPGETKQFRLHEKFVKIFDECVEDSNVANAGVLVAMGLIAPATASTSSSNRNKNQEHVDGILTRLPLCQLEEYSQSIEESGLESVVTLRVVGRVELRKLTQETPYIKATCVELLDDTSALNLGKANRLASDIEHTMFQLGRLEYQIGMYAEGNGWILAEEKKLDLVRTTNECIFPLVPSPNIVVPSTQRSVNFAPPSLALS